MKRTMDLVFLSVVLIALTVGPYPLAIPRALVQVLVTDAKLVQLNPDATKFVARRGPSERTLRDWLEQRGWQQTEFISKPARANHPGYPTSVAGGIEITYEKDGRLLHVAGRFRSGFWWYYLDQAP